MADVTVVKGPHNLITAGVGSCLVITLYDPKLQIGALAHTMLPSSTMQGAEHDTGLSGGLSADGPLGRQACPVAERVSEKVRDTKYVDVAIDEMLERMESQGVIRNDLEAKIIGGANMFPTFGSDIGKDNVSSARRKLKAEGIKIAGECVMGSQGRSVEFCSATGVVTVKTKF